MLSILSHGGRSHSFRFCYAQAFCDDLNHAPLKRHLRRERRSAARTLIQLWGRREGVDANSLVCGNGSRALAE